MASALKQKIDDAFKAAMKAHEASYGTLSLLRAAIKQMEVDGRKELSDEEIVSLIAKEIKKRRDAISDYQQGGRQDLADKEASEITILQKYVPAGLPEAEIKKIITLVIQDLGGSPQMGQVIGKVMEMAKGKADGGTVSRLVKEALTK